MSCCNDDEEDLAEAKAITGIPITGRLVVDPSAQIIEPCAPQPQCITPNTCNPCVPVRARIPAQQFWGVPAVVPQYPQPCGPVLCPENNREIVIREQISGVIKNTHATGMPECGVTINVGFDNVTDVPINGYLWAYGYGYFQIVSFNPTRKELTLLNPCTEQCGSQAAPGTVIPSCTAFVFTPPPCNGSNNSPNSLYPYLNAGFTAPANGNCLLVTVTNVNGLSVNKNVSVNNGIYRISAINSATSITICNDGSGLPAGTVVNYKDSAGNLIVPIVLIDSNPCLNNATVSGKILTCKDGVMRPLSGAIDGQVPVYTESTGEVNFRTLGIPTIDCTSLTVTLTVDPANPPGFSYLIIVADTSDFSAGQAVLIGTTQFIIDSVDSATNLHAHLVVDPIVVEVFNAGSTLCSANCCTVLDTRLTVVENLVDNNTTPGDADWILAVANAADATALGAPVTLTASGDSAVGNVAQLIVPNTSIHTMGVLYGLTFEFELNNFGGTTLFSREVEFEAQVSVDADGTGAFADIFDFKQTYIFNSIGGTATFNSQSERATIQETTTIAAGAQKVFRAKAKMTVRGGNGDHIVVTALGAHIGLLGVAVLPPH